MFNIFAVVVVHVVVINVVDAAVVGGADHAAIHLHVEVKNKQGGHTCPGH